MNNNGEYAATFDYRPLNKLEDLEALICDFKSIGYSVEAITIADGKMYVLFTKKLK
jgi:hypothetical protein